MRRVHSRQRISCSYAFDAAAPENSDTESDYETCWFDDTSITSQIVLNAGTLITPPRPLTIQLSESDCGTMSTYSSLNDLQALQRCSSRNSLEGHALVESCTPVGPTVGGTRKRDRKNPSSGINTMRQAISSSPDDDDLSVSMHSYLKKDISTGNLLELVEEDLDHITRNSKDDNETKNTESSPPFESLGIVDDAAVYILEFLEAEDVRSASMASLRLRRLVCSEEHQHLWNTLCCRQWPLIKKLEEQNSVQLTFRDDYAMCASTGSNFVPLMFTKTNPSVLLGLSAKKSPTSVDLSPFLKCPLRRSPRQHRSQHSHSRLVSNPDFGQFSMSTKLHPSAPLDVVQFNGTVGSGDRCIRSDKPLSRPILQGDRDNCNRIDRFKWSKHGTSRPSLMNLFCRGSLSATSSSLFTKHPSTLPFVSPYVSKVSDTVVELNLTPRLVSYYEITILPRDKSQLPDIMEQPQTSNSVFRSQMAREDVSQHMSDVVAPRTPPMPEMINDIEHHEFESPNECVAIGLSAGKFSSLRKMPGWDDISYGYHGDDGGIFHNSGDMARRFGPSYGPGDTVGCGVDYGAGGIFFTLNGKFLGYGWTGLLDYHGGTSELAQLGDLYPTVGVDTKCPIAFNFGDRPFAFDLSSFTEQHCDLIQGSLSNRGKLKNPEKSVCVPSRSTTVDVATTEVGHLPFSTRTRSSLRRPLRFPVGELQRNPYVSNN
mmetsp:Transcript_29825/g.54623  ORF Transcript_29825/g.54623 Transcript_29825/m.54623 type:complete len:711 (-) Transcript_29825:130-2262(-)|eukprot:CAMPEP_0198292112 /NCGR_PEP_ID=MMETSP1449-20131203/9875_1 /TAXON_ID=420275 /ORGANISM="Attheya septentrionalis, Strain CCMP2084" /LENGTH=710 /DNA_ID=CAMNT_0043990843 /DNA_START=68 /DNA_END=2200 /DNA_ORIENTATION=+